MELLIKEGLETAISCPDAACPRQGHLQENEACSWGTRRCQAPAWASGGSRDLGNWALLGTSLGSSLHQGVLGSVWVDLELHSSPQIVSLLFLFFPP